MTNIILRSVFLLLKSPKNGIGLAKSDFARSNLFLNQFPCWYILGLKNVSQMNYRCFSYLRE